jgi:uncharacterized FlaG/YvyC family protein
MSSSEVNAVIPEGYKPPVPAALPSKTEGQVESNTPAAIPNSNTSTTSDAVSVDVAGVTAVHKQSADSQEQEYGDVQQVAENLKKVFNEIRSTKVAFDVSIQQSGISSLSFQVIDTESGEVVREFPPEIAKSLNHEALTAERAKGLLVEESA